MNKPFKYLPEIFLIVLQFTPLAPAGVIAASFYIFYKVAFANKLDVLSLFLILLPSIVLRQDDVFFQLGQTQFDETSWIKVFIPSLQTSVSIGILVVSAQFFAALAVPVRILRSLNFKNIKIVFFWILALILSFYGLYLAKISGIDSAGGLTVGLRITLSLGVLLFPILINQEELYGKLRSIIKISIVLFLFGLLNEHWLFISVAFPAIILFSNEKKIWKFLSVLMICVLMFLGSTFTIKLILIVSILITGFHKVKRDKHSGFYQLRINPTLLLGYLLFPIYIVFLTISQTLMPIVNVYGSERFISKLFEDRGLLWVFTLNLIRNSNFFVVPAARDISVINYHVSGSKNWEAGAHNIYLEIARQNGFFVFLILFLIVSLFLWNLQKTLYFENRLLMNTCLGLMAVYLVYGLTGNSLVYDGVGFLFWLIFGQVIKNAKIIKTYENTPSVSSQ